MLVVTVAFLFCKCKPAVLGAMCRHLRHLNLPGATEPLTALVYALPTLKPLPPTPIPPLSASLSRSQEEEKERRGGSCQRRGGGRRGAWCPDCAALHPCEAALSRRGLPRGRVAAIQGGVSVQMPSYSPILTHVLIWGLTCAPSSTLPLGRWQREQHSTREAHA